MPEGTFLPVNLCRFDRILKPFILAQSQVNRVGAQGATVYDVTATTASMVAMRDGMHLATDIYRKL